MNNNDLKTKIQEVLDEQKHGDDTITLTQIKQILAATHLEEFLDTLLDYKLKGYNYLKQIKFYTRQIEVVLQNETTNYTFINDYELQANESFSEIIQQIVDIFYSHENNNE